MKNESSGTEYGNWIPSTLMNALWGGTLLTFLCILLNRFWWKKSIITVIAGILFLILFCYTLYMKGCRNCFSFHGGGLMRKIHRYLLTKLFWNGKGELLDIGCGSGALTLLCAKQFPDAKITGIDYWGAEWNYGKEQCERNEKAEGIEGVRFLQGDAKKLPFETGTFDAVVSNFVFHEVRTESNKRKLVKEALRVVKKGGSFAFNDMFAFTKMYGDMEEFIKELKEEGIQEVYYEAHAEKQDFIPRYAATPFMLKGMGILYGRK